MSSKNTVVSASKKRSLFTDPFSLVHHHFLEASFLWYLLRKIIYTKGFLRGKINWFSKMRILFLLFFLYSRSQFTLYHWEAIFFSTLKMIKRPCFDILIISEQFSRPGLHSLQKFWNIRMGKIYFLFLKKCEIFIKNNKKQSFSNIFAHLRLIAINLHIRVSQKNFFFYFQ